MGLSNLGNALRIRSGRTGALADLDEAISLGREAVASAPGDWPDRAMGMSNPGIALQDRFEQTGALADLDEAISLGRQAVTIIAVDHPGRALALSILGNALLTRFQQTGVQAELDEAIDALGCAVDVEAAPPSVRIVTARAASELAAASRSGWAAELMERAVRLLPEVAPRQLERSDQQYALGGLSGLAGDAAALVLAVSSTPPGECATLALRLLEAGRAILYSQALEVRSDLTDLTDQHPGLAARFTFLRDLLDRVPEPAAPSAFPPVGNPGFGTLSGSDRVMHDRRRLAGDLADALAEIRAKEGFGSFAQPPSIGELLQQASSGPVVILNVSLYRSDALLLTEGGITSLPLPGLALDTVITQINTFQQALHTTARGETMRERAAAQREFSKILQWLWDAAASPVLQALGYATQPTPDRPWPRVWWVPGGLLGLLPLHAAGYHLDPASEQGRRTVMDRVVSSYIPTVRALRHARRHSPALGEEGRALIVAMPTTPGIPGELPNARVEAHMVQARLPRPLLLLEPDTISNPADPSAGIPTRANVLAHLPGCAIVHFACHGRSDSANPSNSRLLLHDHVSSPFTVASLAPVNLGQVQLAYLSACETSFNPAVKLIDEAIHLTSAFELAGFPHVIGTLWDTDDAIAIAVARTFYSHLRTSEGTLDTGRAAHALHHAIRIQRNQFPATPSLWAAHIHAGA
jgi:hypothetical protein